MFSGGAGRPGERRQPVDHHSTLRLPGREQLGEEVPMILLLHSTLLQCTEERATTASVKMVKIFAFKKKMKGKDQWLLAVVWLLVSDKLWN